MSAPVFTTLIYLTRKNWNSSRIGGINSRFPFSIYEKDYVGELDVCMILTKEPVQNPAVIQDKPKTKRVQKNTLDLG